MYFKLRENVVLKFKITILPNLLICVHKDKMDICSSLMIQKLFYSHTTLHLLQDVESLFDLRNDIHCTEYFGF